MVLNNNALTCHAFAASEERERLISMIDALCLNGPGGVSANSSHTGASSSSFHGESSNNIHLQPPTETHYAVNSYIHRETYHQLPSSSFFHPLYGSINGGVSNNFYPFPDYYNPPPPNPAVHPPYNNVFVNPSHTSNSPPAIPNDQDNIFDTITHPTEREYFMNRVRALYYSTSKDSSDQLLEIIRALASNPTLLCKSAHTWIGSSTLQRLIRVLRRCEFVSYLTEALAEGFLLLAFHPSGRLVIEECFKELSINNIRVLCIQMRKHCFSMARHESGCILLNASMPYMESPYKDAILEIIHDNAVYLAQDRSGTYVVQNVIAMQHPEYTPKIAEKLRNMIPTLATMREGSFLVEKYLSYAPTKRIVMEVLLELSTAHLNNLACDKFGNYVVQKALLYTRDLGDLHRRLQAALKPLAEDLQNDRYGVMVYEKMENEGRPQTPSLAQLRGWGPSYRGF